jgi:hypothetical protein
MLLASCSPEFLSWFRIVHRALTTIFNLRVIEALRDQVRTPGVAHVAERHRRGRGKAKSGSYIMQSTAPLSRSFSECSERTDPEPMRSPGPEPERQARLSPNL